MLGKALGAGADGSSDGDAEGIAVSDAAAADATGEGLGSVNVGLPEGVFEGDGVGETEGARLGLGVDTLSPATEATGAELGELVVGDAVIGDAVGELEDGDVAGMPPGLALGFIIVVGDNVVCRLEGIMLGTGVSGVGPPPTMASFGCAASPTISTEDADIIIHPLHSVVQVDSLA